jgi:hypothetical protein
MKLKCYKICNGPDRLPPPDPKTRSWPEPRQSSMGLFLSCPDSRACPQGSGRLLAPSGQGERRWPTPQGHQGLGLVQIVAYVAIGTCLARVAGRFDSLAPATALPTLTKMPCRWHCERPRQDDGIHRHAAGNVLHSIVSSLPTEPPFFGRKLNNCNLIFGGQPLKLFARCPIGCARRSDAGSR